MKSTKQLLSDGEKLKTYRTLMKLKQYKVAEELNTEQANYCRMEQGRLNAGWRLEAMRKRFLIWRVGEVERLKKQIDYLNAL